VRRNRYNCHLQDDRDWQDRAETAVALWTGYRDEVPAPAGGELRVADLGCGNERLRAVLTEKLSEGFRYQGYDLHPQLRSTIRLDVRDALPEHYDLVFGLGLLEYLPDLPGFLPRLARVARFAIVSYVLADSPQALTDEERLKRGWKTHHSRSEIADLCEQSGLHVRRVAEIDRGSSAVWLCESSAADAMN
jgi:SAM-dependent methyltransferase